MTSWYVAVEDDPDWMLVDNGQITAALKILLSAMEGRIDSLDEPMVLHSLRVGLAGRTREEQIVGFLHDILEDCSDRVTEDLLREQFPDAIVDAVIAMTKGPRRQYAASIDDVIAAGDLAIRVKLRCVEENLARIDRLAPYHRMRLKVRYEPAERRLRQALEDT